MKKTYLIALSLLFISTCKLQAQVVNNEEDDNEQTEITVTNAQGKEEVIDLPEAMTMELDSLCTFTTRRFTFVLTPHATSLMSIPFMI